MLAAYNRREFTLACLRSLRVQQVLGVTLDAFVLDDASSDGTAEAIAGQFRVGRRWAADWPSCHRMAVELTLLRLMSSGRA